MGTSIRLSPLPLQWCVVRTLYDGRVQRVACTYTLTMAQVVRDAILAEMRAGNAVHVRAVAIWLGNIVVESRGAADLAADLAQT